MPGDTPNFSGRSTIRRYKPAQTQPLLAALPTTNFSSHQHYHHQPTYVSTAAVQPHTNYNTIATPYNHDRRMVSQIQQSLNRAVHSPKPMQHSAFPAFNSPAHHAPGIGPNGGYLPPSYQNYSAYNNHGHVHFGGGRFKFFLLNLKKNFFRGRKGRVKFFCKTKKKSLK